MAGDGGEQESHKVRDLRGCPESYLVRRRVVVCDDSSLLDRVGDQSLVDHPLLDYDFRFTRGRIVFSAADLPLESQVVRGILVQLWRAVPGRHFGVDDGAQLAVFDLHAGNRVGRRLGGVRHDHGDRVAHVADLFERYRRMVRRLHVGQYPACWKRAELFLYVRAGERGHHAGHVGSRGDVYVLDCGVSVRTPYDCQVQHAGRPDVVNVRRVAGDEARVFPAPDRRSDRRCSHSRLP